MTDYKAVLADLIQKIDECTRYVSPGTGGQTIDAQIRRTFIRVPAILIEEARETLYEVS